MGFEYDVYAQWSYKVTGECINRLRTDDTVEVIAGIVIPKQVKSTSRGHRCRCLAAVEKLIPELEKRGVVNVIDPELSRRRPGNLPGLPCVIVNDGEFIVASYVISKDIHAHPSILDDGGPLGLDTLETARQKLAEARELELRKLAEAEAAETLLGELEVKLADGEDLTAEEQRFVMLTLVRSLTKGGRK